MLETQAQNDKTITVDQTIPNHFSLSSFTHKNPLSTFNWVCNIFLISFLNTRFIKESKDLSENNKQAKLRRIKKCSTAYV